MSSKPFDTATKQLIERYPESWLQLSGVAVGGAVRVIDADLATVIAEADKVLCVDAPEPSIVHLEMQSTHSSGLGARLLKYNVLFQDRHEAPVRSVVILLRREADGTEMSGTLRRTLPGGEWYLDFRYNVVRLWDVPAEQLLAGGLGTLPLAPLGKSDPAGLPAPIRRMDERLRAEAAPDEAATLWTATFLLLGLQYSREFASRLLKGVSVMKESSTYQAILEEGREEGREQGREQGRAAEARTILLRQGRKQFGEPTEEITARLEAIDSIERLESLSERLLDVQTWEELLGTP